MNLTINHRMPGCADGNYQVKAKGFIMASLHWADENGALPDWQTFACLPIDPNGAGMYKMEGRRVIPQDATHVLARAVSEDFSSVEEVLTPIPKSAEAAADTTVQRYLVMTDLHLSNKSWHVRKALMMGADYDAVLITGDMTNDGTPEQLERFWENLQELLPNTPVFAVTGNHDYPRNPLPCIPEGICDYPHLQQALLDRAAAIGIPYQQDVSGAYAAMMGDIAIIGLNAATHWRRFKFPDNSQLEFLEQYLKDSHAKQHLVLCHAPLANHRPYKEKGEVPYLSRDKELQKILTESGKPVVFLSGHTHVSMNCRGGCVDRDEQGNLYVNAGSIRPTTLKPDELIQPESWTEGNVVEFLVGENQITVTGISMKTGQRIARGFYRANGNVSY